MFYKNATIFHLKAAVDLSALEVALPELALKECGSQDEFSFGSLPLVRNSETWFLQSNGCFLMRFSKEEKVLPSSVVREELDTKVAEIELIEGRKVGRKEQTDMKDELVFTLRPKAFSKRTDVWMHIDTVAHIVVIYSTTATMIELAFKHLQTMLGSFAMVPLQVQVSPPITMSEWLIHNTVPVSLETGDACEVKDSSKDKIKITFKSLEPLSRDITDFLQRGVFIRNLALRWSDKLHFVLHDDLTIRKIKWDDAIKEAAFNDSQGGGLSDMDATFALTSLTTRQFFYSLSGWFEIEVNEQEQVA